MIYLSIIIYNRRNILHIAQFVLLLFVYKHQTIFKKCHHIYDINITEYAEKRQACVRASLPYCVLFDHYGTELKCILHSKIGGKIVVTHLTHTKRILTVKNEKM